MIPPLCNERFKNFAFVIDDSPGVVSFAIDPHEYIVEMLAPLYEISV